MSRKSPTRSSTNMKLISLLVFFSEKSVEAGYVTESDDFDVNTEQTMTSEDEHMMNYRVKVQCKMEFGVIEGFNSTDSCSDLYFENSCCEFGVGCETGVSGHWGAPAHRGVEQGRGGGRQSCKKSVISL